MEAVDRPGEDPLLLVHGYMDTTASHWWQTARGRLADRGYDPDRIHQLDLGSIPGTTVGSPRTYARRLADAVDDLTEKQDDRVDIIAHSMGGLCARWAIEQLDAAEHVDDLVTLGTPHQGSYLAYLGAGTAGGRAMIPGSSFLETLNASPLPPDVDYTAVWSGADRAIQPAEHAALPVSVFRSMADTRNVWVEGASHMDLVADRSVFEKYVGYLE